MCLLFAISHLYRIYQLLSTLNQLDFYLKSCAFGANLLKKYRPSDVYATVSIYCQSAVDPSYLTHWIYAAYLNGMFKLTYEITVYICHISKHSREFTLSQALAIDYPLRSVVPVCDRENSYKNSATRYGSRCRSSLKSQMSLIMFFIPRSKQIS